MKKNNNFILGLIIVVLIASVLYIKIDSDKRISNLNSQLEEFTSQHNSEMNAINTILNNLKSEYQSGLNTLSSKVKKTQEESEELKASLKEISVSSGDFSAIIEDVIKGVVSIITDKGQGSGAIISKDGYLVTNYHVIKDATQLSIVDHKNNIFPGKLIGFDSKNDIAVLKINVNRTFNRLGFANSDNVKVGEKVIAVGNPGGLGFTVTEGIISQVDRVLFPGAVGLIQTDVAINPGNSGGPLINTEGKVIGITRLKVKNFESLGFAIPSNFIMQKVESIIENQSN